MTVVRVGETQNNYTSKHPDELFTPVCKKEKFRTVPHILIKIENINEPAKKELEKAQKVGDVLKKGDSFTDAAKEYSDNESASDGGYLDYVDSDTSYANNFKNATFKLKAREISD